MGEEGISRLKKSIEEGRVGIGMVMVQVIATGLQLLSRLILNQGTFVFAYMFYRHIVAALCVLPFALFFERGKGLKLIRSSWRVLSWLFAVALTGITMAMGLFYYGLRDTTATYATNFLNLIPIATFLFSTILGFEKLGINTRNGKVKIMGAILCLVGALVIVFYKGKELYLVRHPLLLDLEHHHHHHSPLLQMRHPHWVRGTIFLLCSCVSYGLWFITQAKLIGIYPHKYWATFYTSLIASAQQVLIGLYIDSSKSAWKLEWDLQLLTIFYSGALATAATFCLITWAVSKRGPTYPSMFNPLSLIFVAIAEALLLASPISLGSLIGMVLIIVGIYYFLWAKRKEAKGAVVVITTTSAAVGQASQPTVAVTPLPPHGYGGELPNQRA
ncbi:OLC1v1020962C2 [Oldenlandia corymbosa var. corymbosa]|uniref:WAT1-related protein n=1 Tax=Oldenlandia corymbosa var. corymbosa TaxID=529605 RepID=A0AAV1BX18_OLDCO|nr:OLC1v1020962C2 [Oldenlandia corymbosa var. corymbosa]